MTTNCRCVYVYRLSKKEWKLLFREDQFQAYATVGTFKGVEGLVCLGNSSGQARLFDIDRPGQVSSSLHL